MVLDIDGIHKFIGHLFCGRVITNIESATHFGTRHYIFHFDNVPGYQPGPFHTWEDKFVIHLVREPKNGSYELYWMGLHGVTCQRLDISEVRNFHTFYTYFERVVRLGKAYWDESKTYKS